MSLRRPVAFDPTAERELEEARDWAKVNAPATARALDVELAALLILLEQCPEMGPRVRSGRWSKGVRRLVMRTGYLLYYCVEPDVVMVLRFWHQKRKPLKRGAR